MKFTTRKAARYYLKSHAPAFRKRLQIVPTTWTTVNGDVEGCRAEDINFETHSGYTVVLVR